MGFAWKLRERLRREVTLDKSVMPRLIATAKSILGDRVVEVK